MSTNSTSIESQPRRVTVFDTVATFLLVGLVAVIPFFFIPFLGVAVEIPKIYFFGFFVSVILIIWIIARLIEGAISIPKTPILFAAISIPVTFFISALFSPAPLVSLFGVPFSIGSVWVIALLTLVFLGSSVYLGNPHRLKILFKALIGSTIIIALFEIAYLVLGAKILNLGTFFSSISNTVGSWNDLGIFFGAVTLGLIITLEVAPLSKLQRIGAWVLLVLALFLLVCVNFTLLWGIIAAFSIVLLVYSLAVLRVRGEEPRTHFPVAPFVTILIALFFLIANPVVGNIVPKFFGLQQADVRPSFGSTTSVVWQSISEHPIVGVGPNRFSNAWLAYRPQEVAITNYWDTAFSSGFGFIPSLIATTGILGTLALILFLVLFIIAGLLHIFRSHEKKDVQTLIFLSFILAVYGWFIAVVYNPGVVSLFATFLFSGIFIGLITHEGFIPVRKISFLDDPRKSFFSILGLVVLLVGVLVSLFVTAQKAIALYSYGSALHLARAGDTSGAEQKFNRAIALDPTDLYFRDLVSLRLSQINTLINTPNTPKETLKQNLQVLFSSGEGAARSAIQFDKTNSENWLTLALLYKSVVPFGVEGAYKNAKDAYDEVRKLSPGNPGIDVLSAGLEIESKNLEEAKKYVDAALIKKPNFIDAYILLSKIDASLGDATGSLAALEKAVAIAPTNASALFELGTAKYRSAEYESAVSLLERSFVYNRTSASTAYFLALTYEKLGRIDDTKLILTSLTKSFPKDINLAKMLENVTLGKNSQDGLASGAPESVQKEKTTEKK